MLPLVPLKSVNLYFKLGSLLTHVRMDPVSGSNQYHMDDESRRVRSAWPLPLLLNALVFKTTVL